MICELPLSYRPAAFMVRPATPGWELETAYALRRAVFCAEQGIFVKDDRDTLDASALHLVAMSCVAGDIDDVVGTVRVNQVEPSLFGSSFKALALGDGSSDVSGEASATVRLFSGSRLAVHPSARGANQIGSVLVTRAVRSAVTLGATDFVAHIQLQNVRLFERLHWHVLDTVVLHGRRHALMRADLNHYATLIDVRATDVVFTRGMA